MAEMLSPLSFWMQLSSFFFFMSGLHGDLLVIRFFLVLAYSMLVVNSVVGSPLWPFATSEGISVDGLVWAAVSLYVHGASLLALIWDERDVHLDDDQAALWRMMYRTGGLSKRLFHAIVATKLDVVELPAGRTIPTDEHFYIIYNGQVRLQVVERNVSKSSRILVSGEMFDLNAIGMFTEQSVFYQGGIRCTTITPCRLFCIQKDHMTKISHHPLAKSVWQALLINNLSYVVESYLSEEHRSIQAELYCDKIFRPLEHWEQPKSSLAGSGQVLAYPFRHLLAYVQSSFSPPWPFQGHPTGIRQTQLPPPLQQRPPPEQSQEPPRFHMMFRSLRTLTTRTTTNSSGGGGSGEDELSMPNNATVESSTNVPPGAEDDETFQERTSMAEQA